MFTSGFVITVLIEGIIFGSFVYGPLVFYAIWSWHWLRHAADAHNGRIWVKPLAVSAIVTIIWSIVVNMIIVFYLLALYNLKGEEQSFAESVLTVAFLPAIVANKTIKLLPNVPIYYEAPWLYWLLTGSMIMVLLIAISVIEWLFIRLTRVSASVGPV